MAHWIRSHEFLAFVLLALLITFIGWAWLLLGLPGGGAANLIGLWGPALSALLVTAVTRKKAGLTDLLRGLLNWRVPLRWYLVILLGWPAISLLAALLYAWAGGQPFTLQWGSWPTAAAFLAQSPLLAFWACEEIGWRGFALPRLLDRWNALLASIFLGLVWGLWHLPYFLGIPGLDTGVPFYVFLLMLAAVSILMTWIYQHTGGSLLVMTLFHFWFNVYEVWQMDTLRFANPGGEMTVRYALLALAAAVVVLLFGYRSLKRVHGKPARMRLRPTGA